MSSSPLEAANATDEFDVMGWANALLARATVAPTQRAATINLVESMYAKEHHDAADLFINTSMRLIDVHLPDDMAKLEPHRMRNLFCTLYMLRSACREACDI